MYDQVKTGVADMQFLFCDIALVTVLAIVMGRGGPSDQLHPCRPPASLLSLPVLGSLFIHTSMIILGQVAALLITTSQDWSVEKRQQHRAFISHHNILQKHFIMTFYSLNKILCL